MFAYILDVLLVTVAVFMLFGGKYGVTRQLGLVPLLVAVLDAAFAAQIDAALTPVLSGLLVMLQVVIAGGSALLLYQDHVHARNKQARRNRRRELARTAALFDQRADRRTADTHRICA